MCQMLLSINPEYVASILQGKKLYDKRESIKQRDLEKEVRYHS